MSSKFSLLRSLVEQPEFNIVKSTEVNEQAVQTFFQCKEVKYGEMVNPPKALLAARRDEGGLTEGISAIACCRKFVRNDPSSVLVASSSRMVRAAKWMTFSQRSFF